MILIKNQKKFILRLGHISSVVSMSDKLAHYDQVRQDLRDELKQRIVQRDNFAIQFFVALGTIAAGAITSTYYLVVLMPLYNGLVI